MTRLFKLQFLGPLALFVATLSAEIATRALEYAPSSKILWFINLRMFGIALPIFALACLGLVARSRLPLAVATQLSAGYATFLVLSWRVGVSATAQASLGPIAVPTGAGFYVLATIVGACLLSFVVSHLVYLLAVREELYRWRRRSSSAKTSSGWSSLPAR